MARIIDEHTDPATLTAGEEVLFSGVAYTARDAAHKRFVEAADGGEPLPVDIRGAAKSIFSCSIPPGCNSNSSSGCLPRPAVPYSAGITVSVRSGLRRLMPRLCR